MLGREWTERNHTIKTGNLSSLEVMLYYKWSGKSPLLWRKNPTCKLDIGWEIHLLGPRDCPALFCPKENPKISVPIYMGRKKMDTLPV